jgi:regulator of protease activity HflC (stomatin/prohibitin superfamily)
MKTIALMLLIAAAAASCAVVPPGHVAVRETFGAVSNDTWGPGIHTWGPWFGVHRIDCRTTQLEERTSTPTGEGLVVSLDVSVVYHATPEAAVKTFAQYGGVRALVENVLRPELRSTIRDVTASYNASDLYSGKRELVTRSMQSTLTERLAGRGLTVEAVLLRDFALPEQVANAVQAKLAADQQAQQMKFVLQKESSEAERKRIEAQGIADFQRIVTAGITPGLLEWKGIEATELLAKSANSKVVVIGGGKNGLPLILGQ